MPNTHVPAAGEAMPAANETRIIGRFSRRALLGAFASVPAIGAATAALALPAAMATATIPPAPAEHPDADLFRLDQEMEQARAKSDLAQKVVEEIDQKVAKLYPRSPRSGKSRACRTTFVQ